MAGDPKRRIRIGIPGMDPVFPRGIPAGSVIVIAGGPGSGKTLLAAQLLMELQWPDGKSEQNTLLLTADEDAALLEQNLPDILPAGESVQDPRIVGGGLPPRRQLHLPRIERLDTSFDAADAEIDDAFDRILKIGQDKDDQWWNAFRPSVRELGSAVRRLAFDKTLDHIAEVYTGKPWGPLKAGPDPYVSLKPYRALAIDGILNLRELHGADPVEQRQALLQTARMLRHLIRREQNEHMAAIITAELPAAAEEEARTHQLEDYLADVVVHVGLDEPVKGRRRRFLEVVKARFANPTLGTHSMYIMSPEEVRRRRRTHASIGWSDETLCDIRRGVVVFPQMRWHSQPAGGALSPRMQDWLIALRKTLAKPSHDDVRKRLGGHEIEQLIGRVLRGLPLEVPNLKTLDDLLWALAPVLADADLRKNLAPESAPDDESGAEQTIEGPQQDPTFWDFLESWPDGPIKLLLGLLRARDPKLRDPGGEIPGILQTLAASQKETQTPQAVIDLSELGAFYLSVSDDPQSLSEMVRLLIRLLIRLMKELVNLRHPERAGFCEFGIHGLDYMFTGNPQGQGVLRGTSTAIIGAPGTGKSTLAYRFMLTGLEQGENVIFLSFDERHRRILQQSGSLTNKDNDHDGRRTNQPDPPQSRLLAEVIARQVLDADLRGGGKLRFIYEQPVTADLNELIHFLGREIPLLKEDRPGRGGQPAKRPHYRLIIDSLSDLQRNVPDPILFSHFVSTLLNKAADLNVTTLLVYESPSGSDDGAVVDLSHLSDNIIRLRHILVNNSNRKCLTVDKARGSAHDASSAELVFAPDRALPGGVNVLVRKGFEGMSKVLTGNPQPANIDLCLFHENRRERRCNHRFLAAMRAKYGRDRVRYVPFTLSNSRRAYYHRAEGRDVRPDADVTVVSLDEPWVKLLAAPHSSAGPTLATWEPRHATPSQKWLVSNFIPALRVYAHNATQGNNHTPQAKVPELAPMLAMPHYFDLGLLVRRADITGDLPDPTCWETVRDGPRGLGFEDLVQQLSLKHNCPGFAFDMNSAETTACVFIEMCWNFMADQDFLVKPSEWNIRAASAALQMLARLRWSGALPFPCTTRQCARAIYTRAWYATLPKLRRLAGAKARFQVVPFPSYPASTAPDPEFARDSLRTSTDSHLQRINSRNSAAPASSSVTTYRDHLLGDRMSRDDCARQQWLQRYCGALVNGWPGAGWSCSGAWYLGVISDGGNAQLGWSLVEEALDPDRVEKRAMFGAGLPSLDPFYRDYSQQPVPFLDGMTFGHLRQQCFPQVRPRETALGIGTDLSAPPSPSVLDACRELPELLHALVRHVLGDPLSKPDPANPLQPNPFVENQLRFLFRQITPKAKE